MRLTKKDLAGMISMTGEEKRMFTVLVALALLGLVGRYTYLYGKTPKPVTPAELPAAVKPAPRAPVAE